MTYEEAFGHLRAAVRELNRQLAHERRVAAEEDLLVTGPEAALDSLGYLTLVLTIDAQLAGQGSTTVDMTSQLLPDDGASAPRTLGAIAHLLASMSDEANG